MCFVLSDCLVLRASQSSRVGLHCVREFCVFCGWDGSCGCGNLFGV